MRVLIVYPEPKMWPIPNLGMLYLAAVLEREGHEVEIFDFSREYFHGRDGREAFEAYLASRPPFDVAGIGYNTPQTFLAHHAARAIRSRAPSALIVLGGPHPSALPEDALRECPVADVVVRNEGDYVFRDLVGGMPFKSINGITYRAGAGFASTPPAPLVADLDELPMPAWHLIDAEYYIAPKPFDDYYASGRRMGTVMASRGCFGRCNFCQSWRILGTASRMHSPARVVTEIERMIDLYGVEIINFQDDTLLLEASRAKELCDAFIASGIHRRIQWNCQLLAAQATPAVLDMFAEAGCYQVAVGFETLAPDTLRSMRKPASYARNMETVRHFKRSKVRCLGYFMSGYRGESAESVLTNQTMQKYAALEMPTWTHYVPFPGTSDFTALERSGELGDRDWITYDMAQNAASLLKRNYSAMPTPEYLRHYLWHIENYHFVRRLLNGIERRTQAFARDTGLAVPELGWPKPTADRERLDPALREAWRHLDEWDLAEAHQRLLGIDPGALPAADRRLRLDALIFIHLVRCEDDEAQALFRELEDDLDPGEAALALARGNCQLANHANALRILLDRRASLDGAGRRQLLFLAILRGRGDVVEDLAAEFPLDIETRAAARVWRSLAGTPHAAGLPHVFGRYPAGEAGLSAADGRTLDRLLAPHRYRFLTHFLPMERTVRETGATSMAALGFDRWARQLHRHLAAVGDIAFAGYVDDRLAQGYDRFGGAPVLGSEAAARDLPPDAAVIVTNDTGGEAAREALRTALGRRPVHFLFPKASDLGLMPSLTRELHGMPIHRFA